MSLVRYDGIVFDNVPRPVPGASIYVLNQPTTSLVPPYAPLASVFSDSAGITPLANPFTADGNGNYFFYAAAGTYTVVVSSAALAEPNIKPDQGLVQSAATAVVLKTNSVTNTTQALLNLVQGANITLSETAGAVTIAATAVPITFKHNGTDNSVQNLLNLIGGSGISVSESAGAVTIAFTGGLTLQVNGTPNVSQSLLNLFAGTGISLADNGSGRVTIANTLLAGSVIEVNGGALSSPTPVNFVGGNEISISNPSAGTIEIDSSVSVRTVTTTYLVLATDGTILANGTFTATLPTVSVPAGKIFRFKNTGAGTITVACSANIDGASTNATMTTQYSKLSVQWDGSTYWII